MRVFSLDIGTSWVHNRNVGYIVNSSEIIFVCRENLLSEFIWIFQSKLLQK